MATHASHSTFSGKSFAVLAGAAAAITVAILLLMNSGTRPDAHKAIAKLPPKAPDVNRYSGSIVVQAQRNGDMCLERVFDNRTAKMSDRGYVKCDSDPAPLPGEAKRPGNMDVYRLNEVGKAFRRENE